MWMKHLHTRVISTVVLIIVKYQKPPKSPPLGVLDKINSFIHRILHIQKKEEILYVCMLWNDLRSISMKKSKVPNNV